VQEAAVRLAIQQEVLELQTLVEAEEVALPQAAQVVQA